jgi:hypothetical protein
MPLNHLFNEVVLDQVGILKFIDHYILAEFLISPQDFWKALEKSGHEGEKVFKVEGIVSSKVFLISLVDQAQSLLKDIEFGGAILIWGDALILQLFESGLERSGMEHPEVEIQLLHHRFEVPFLILLVINDEIFLKPKGLNVFPQDADTGRMEGGNPGPFGGPSEKSLHPFSHLIGCLIGERDRQDIPGVDSFLLNQISDPISQDPCLSTSSTCKDQKRSLRFQNSLLLNRVEIVEQRHGFSKCQMSKSKCQTNVKIPNEENLGFEIWDSFEL